MRKEILALFLVLVMLCMAGCGNTGTEASTGGAQGAGDQAASAGASDDSAAASSSSIGLDKVFKYGDIKSYEYRMTSEGTTVNLKTTVSSDSVDGVAAWLTTQVMDSQGAQVTSKMWMDKATQKCLKITSSVVYNGQEMSSQETPCPTTGANSASNAKAPEIRYAGKDSVTVPAGTFTADKYSGESITYWVSSKAAVPVKYASDDGKMVMELVSYS